MAETIFADNVTFKFDDDKSTYTCYYDGKMYQSEPIEVGLITALKNIENYSVKAKITAKHIAFQGVDNDIVWGSFATKV